MRNSVAWTGSYRLTRLVPNWHDSTLKLRLDDAIDTYVNSQERIERDASDFLKAIDSEGERIDLHSLRHTTASWLIQSGADVKTVQAIMRHSDIRLTMDKYGHLFPGSEAAAMERMRSFFIHPVAIRKTGTSDLQQNLQQSGIFGVRNGA
jgi:integrase